MFSLATGIYQSYFAPPKLSIVILGLDGSGKTALLERIKVTEINNDYNTGDASSFPFLLPSMYIKGGAAVAGVDDGSLDESRQHKFAKYGSGGRAARLPPPLSPKQALESRRLVDIMLKEGFSNLNGDNASLETSVSDARSIVDLAANAGGNAAAASSTTRLALEQICPPPLVPILEKDGIVHRSSSNDAANSQMIKPTSVLTQQKALGTKLTLPPPSSSSSLSSSSTSSGKKSMTSKIPTTVQHKKNTFVGLLRCPSPMKYSNAVDDDEYEEQPLDDEHLEESSWNTEYLRDYYINYQAEEEFDVKNTRAGNGGGVGGGQLKKMFPLDRIRPTLGQNLATLDMRGCKCSIFDLSGAEKMRPLWERYYQDADAIIYVVNAAETSIPKLRQSRHVFEQMCANDIVNRRVRCGLPVLILANQLDVAYQEYNDSLERANSNGDVQNQQHQNDVGQRGISWNADEEDNFIGGMKESAVKDVTFVENREGVSKRVVDFEGLALLYGFPRPTPVVLDNGRSHVQCASDRGNIFFFGGSAKTGEGVRAAMEYLVTQAKSHHLARNPRR